MKSHNHRKMLERLTDALVEDILAASDEEILSESSGDFETTKAVADHVRGLLEKAQVKLAKNRLLAAKEAVAKQKTRPRGKVIRLDPTQARRKLDELLHEHPEATREFTLAARKGKDLSDSDIMSMLEDLQELGLYNPETNSENDQ